jgi:hypothetical protein
VAFLRLALRCFSIRASRAQLLQYGTDKTPVGFATAKINGPSELFKQNYRASSNLASLQTKFYLVPWSAVLLIFLEG